MTADPLGHWSDLAVLVACVLVMATAMCAGMGYDGAALVLGIAAAVVVIRAAAG